MLWIVLGVIAAALVLAVAVAGAVGVFDSPMVEPERRDPLAGLRNSHESAEVVANSVTDAPVRFSPALYGYRMEEVDAYIAVLKARIGELEGEGETTSAMEDEVGTAVGEQHVTPRVDSQ